MNHNDFMSMMLKLAFFALVMVIFGIYTNFTINQHLAELSSLLELHQVKLEKVELQIKLIQLQSEINHLKHANE